MEEKIEQKEKVKFEEVKRGGFFYRLTQDTNKKQIKLAYELQILIGEETLPINAVCLCCGDVSFIDYNEIVEIET